MQTPNLFAPPEQVFVAWEDALDRWSTEWCVFRDKAWGGIAALHKDFERWADRPVLSLEGFTLWLIDQGFSLDQKYGLVYGLILRCDWESVSDRGSSDSSSISGSTVGEPATNSRGGASASLRSSRRHKAGKSVDAEILEASR